MDPPYGIKFASNFQPKIGQRDVKDKDDDLTREPEMVRAYRDTWNLGVHSYLTYLRDRLVLAKELLKDEGSIFVQISDENLHRVRCVMDEVFGSENFCGLITFAKTSSFTSELLSSANDYLLWYAKDKSKVKYNKLLQIKRERTEGGTYTWVETPSGESRRLTSEEIKEGEIEDIGKRFRADNIVSSGASLAGAKTIAFSGKEYLPSPNSHWKTSADGMNRLALANRVLSLGKVLAYKRYEDDFPLMPFSNVWDDTIIGTFSDKFYVVQTAERVIERCLLMTSDPGDLVFDPTCGSGTTAVVAETWGRRWITCDTSRVALAIARQRILTAKFDAFEFADEAQGVKGNFQYKTVPHITLKSIAQNPHLDPIFEKFNPRLEEALQQCNAALSEVTSEERRALKTRLAMLKKPTDADKRRFDLPSERFEHWTVPFDVAEEYPVALQSAILEYRKIWREKMDAVNAQIASSAESETLYDKPILRKNVVRVSGPFTVEAVQPPEMSLSAPQILHPEIEEELPAFSIQEVQPKTALETQNAASYLENLTALLKSDGVTFPGNRKITFDSLEAHSFGSTPAHAVGTWHDENGDEQRAIISFGPQYGPIGARQVEEVGRVAYKQGFDAAIFAGFAFDATASAMIERGGKIPFHLAHIRPDVNPAMDGLLKTTPNSQLFSVFGSPRVAVEKNGDEYSVSMQGMDIYDPVKNEITPTGASKVAAWFLDCDYDNRTFCINQAFFPDQNAWEKIGKALGNSIDVAAFSGTKSVPFKAGENRKVAVKVIDPRGNEVMSVEELN
jgi:adenine-specific DNA-methyltransferase